MTRGRWVAVIVTGVALALVVTLVVFGRVVATQQERVVAAVGKALGREVHVERLGITLRGGVGVALEGVRIAEDPAFGGGPLGDPFLGAERFELRLRLWPLLQRRLVVDRVVLEAPAVNLVRDASGRLNVESLGKHDGTKKPEATSDDGERTRPAIQLANLRLRHGTIRYLDRGTGRGFTLSDVALDARQPTFDGPMPLSLRARLDGKDLRLDDIESAGVLELDDGRPSYHGTLRTGAGALGELALDGVDAELEASPPVMTLEHATIRLLGGAVRGKGRVASGGDTAGLSADVDAAGLDLEKLPAKAGRPRPAGVLALQATVSGPAPGSPGFRDALSGTGRFAIADGRVEDLPLGRTLREALGPLFGEERAARLRERYPDLFGGDDLRFTKLAGSGRLAHGRIVTDDLTLAGASYQATGQGSFGLDATLDLALRLAASSALTDDLLGRSKARPVLVDADGRLAVPLRVHGPLKHPAVSPDPAFAATVARGLLGGRNLGDVAGGLLERLLGGKRKKP